MARQLPETPPRIDRPDGPADDRPALVAENDRLRGEIATLQAGAALSQSAASDAAHQALREENARLRELLAQAEAHNGGDAPRLVIICARPGFRRGGVVHPARAEYPLDAFTAGQLHAFRSEPALSLVEIGGRAVPNPLEPERHPGQPFVTTAGTVAGVGAAALRVLSDPELRERAHEAVVAQAVGAPDAGIKTEAVQDLARRDYARR